MKVSESAEQKRNPLASRRTTLIGIAICAVVMLALVLRPVPNQPVAQVEIEDGRTIVIEAVTYGTNHVVGRNSVILDRFGPWLPRWIYSMLQPRFPRSTMTTKPDTLVVWMHAINSGSGTNVDCQDIRVEFGDSRNDLWGETTRSWSGFQKFSRVGHVFEAYPRSEPELKLWLFPWRAKASVFVSFPNPRLTPAANWVGDSLPARREYGEMEVVLDKLIVRTRGGPNNYWETPSRYWDPNWRIVSNGAPASGWRQPEWTATDPLGNSGQHLGIRQPLLRFSAKFLPEVMNLAATKVIASLPHTPCTSATTNTIWFNTNSIAGNNVVAIGLMTATMTHFTDGEYDPNPPMTLRPTRGGAPTGWTASSRRITPTRVRTVRGHYADRPVIYLQCEDREAAERLGIRLRDAQGRIWPTTREGDGPGIIPFMLDVPADVTSITPEIVLLKQIEAEFTVKTPVATP